MKTKLLNKIWLRTLVVVAVMTTAFAGQAWGETVTMRYQGTTTGNFGTGNEAATVGLDASQWSVIADKGKASNNVGFNKAGDIRLYYHVEGSNTLTVSSLTESTINSIKITFTGDDYSNVTVTVDGEAVTATDGVYAINSTSFVLGNGNTSNVQVRIASVLIDYTPSGINPVCTTPTISGEDQFLESTEVSITCSTEGATIKYSTNNGSSWTNYSAPFTLTATTTVLAKATKNGMNDSEVASKTFTKAEILTVAQARDAIDEAGEEKVPNVYAKGIVSTIVTPYNSEFKNITFNIVDNAGDEVFLQAYRCGGDEAANVMVGDEVLVFGDLTKFKDTYEFAQGCEIVSLTHVEHQAYTLTIGTLENIELFIFDDPNGTELIESGARIPWGTTIYISPDPAEGYLLDAITVTDASNENIVLADAGGGMWSFVMPKNDVTINATVVEIVPFEEVKYTLATSITPGKRYIITDGKGMAMGKQNTNNRVAVEVAISDGVATVSSANVFEFVIESATIGQATGYSIYDESAESTGYLYAASSGSNHLKTQKENDVNGVWTITIDSEGLASIVAEGSSNRNVMQYNNSSSLFSCYASASQKPVYLFEKVEAPTVTYTITFHNGEDTKTQTVNEGEETKLEANTFEKEGYVFIGWNTKEDGTGDSYPDEGTITPSENLDLYAQWQMLGDVNGDEEVTIADVVAIINYLLDPTSAKFNEAAANVDGQDGVTLADALAIINKIIGEQ